jgi:hypothetical protein
MKKSIRERCGSCLWPALVAAAAGICAAQTTGAQTGGRLTFEVASVKPAAPYFPPEGRGPSEKVEWGRSLYGAQYGTQLTYVDRFQGGRWRHELELPPGAGGEVRY